MSEYLIGQAAGRVGLSPDTLRYYEKIGLLPTVSRNSAGRRMYVDKDISRLNFVKRAQRMNFTLAEIAQLLEMRENPQGARDEVRALSQQKLAQIEEQLKELTVLKNEMRLLINLCNSAEHGCPIIEELENNG
ncbi:MAG: heavy metal-responsive transcriptional regulator [Acidiferrobacterales bacterium]